MTDRFGHITLNGYGYKIDLGSYRSRDVSDFAPRATTPGGGVIHSEMSLFQPLNQTDWRHGFGFHWHTDASGYMSTTGNVDTRQSGIATLFTEISARISAERGTGGFMQPHGLSYIIFWSPAVARTYSINSSGVVAQITALTTALNYVWTNGTYTFACPDGGRIQKSNASDLVTWTDAGVDADSTDYKKLMMHDGFVYALKDGTNRVYYADSVDLSDLEGAADDIHIAVGAPGRDVINAISFAGDLFFARVDGLWRMDKDQKYARRVLDYTDQVHAYNFQSMAIFNGSLIFPIRNQLYMWNGVRVSPITPPAITDTYPYKRYTNFNNFCVIGNFLYMTAKTSDNLDCDLLCFDGVGWHRLCNLTTGNAAYSCRSMNQILFAPEALYVDLTSGASGVYKIPLSTYVDTNSVPYPTTGTHSLISSRLDAGFRRITKSSPSLLVEGSNLSAGHRYLKIYYQLDSSGTWTAWGGTDGTTNVVSANGVTELKNPEGHADGVSALEYYWMQIRVDYVTDSSSYTPVLEGMTLRLLMRPDTDWGYAFNIWVEKEGELAMGNVDTRTPKELADALRTCRDSKSMLTFTDIYGVTHWVYVTSVTEMAADEVPEDLGTYPNISGVVQVNIVEVRV